MTKIGNEWRISDALLREIILEKLVERILEPFTDFYMMHSQVTFSKKHMKVFIF